MNQSAFAITETLSHDENATLYRAIRRRDSLPVVLKVLGPQPQQPREVERLRNELDIAGALDQGSVLRPLTMALHEGMPALVSEDFAGVPLEQLLGAPFDIGRFLSLGSAMAAGLEQVHRAGLVHKDVTPRNIFVKHGTQEVRLYGFGLASRIPRQPPVGQAPELIEGTLPFMSPEQTGRMNRTVDSRSDLYSLGVLFFFMLTGRLPFAAHDALGWVHAHVARPVPSVGEIAPGVPPIISAIVRRLMEKMPENRYQSAHGLHHDLERARAAWVATGRIDPFPLGELDVSHRLKIPQRLYGREPELTALLGLLDEMVASGRPALALVSGYSGVGKSGLVHELLRSIEGAGALFLSGKFDVQQRNIPYSTFAQAFRRALRDLAGAGEEYRASWRARLSEALGANGRLIAEIIPETELLLGPQPPVVPLPPIEAEERFRMVFHAFITAFGTADHPLVLFLDDLQWADIASLKLLQNLLTTPDTRHLLVFGAYRDKEVDDAHPLPGTIRKISEAGVRVSELLLGTLSVDHVVAFTSDAVRRPAAEVRPLAALIYEKTAGNPFFVIQFVTELVRGGLLAFDPSAWRWRWDLERIKARGYSDDVAQFMVGRIERLPPATREALCLAACVGNTTDVRTLAAIAEEDEASIQRNLFPAVEQSLLILTVGQRSYRFAHDRVQQAAYSLVEETDRPVLHLRIGRLLLEMTPPEKLGDRIFEIVNQLNRGRALIEPQERIPFAELSLRAGRKAIAAAAHATARTYLTAGVEMLPARAWETSYELAFTLHLEVARAAFFAGDVEGAQHLLQELHTRARRPQDVATVASVEVYLFTVTGRLGRALEVMRPALHQHGLDVSLHPAWEEVTRKYDIVKQAIADRPGAGTIQALIGLPRAQDPGIVALEDLLAMLLLPALLTDENLLALLALTAVELSIHHGLTDATASACVMVAMVGGRRLGRQREADAFGRLGRAIVDQRGLSAYRAKVYLDFALVNHWSHPLRTNLPILQEALESARATGNIAVACYSLNNLVALALSLGRPLPEVQRQCEEALHFIRRARFPAVEAVVISQLRLVLNLRGATAQFSTFDGDDFDEGEFVAGLETNPHSNVLAICWHSIRKLQARFFSCDYEEAYAASLRARMLLWTSRSFVENVEYHLYTALTVAALCDLRPAEERPALMAELEIELERFRGWAETCPENFLPKRELIEGEHARVRGDGLAAMRHYEAAIQAARDSSLVQNEAIAHELAARFSRTAGLAAASTGYLAEAWRCYRSWGAEGKVRSLERDFPELEARRAPPAGTPLASADQLDLLAVAKASQAISVELSWDRVARRLLEVALEQGGAGYGCLLVRRDNQLLVAATAGVDHSGVTTSLVDPPRPPDAGVVPATVADFVCRGPERVVLDDASAGGPFADDPYIRAHGPRSLLGLPIVSQDEVVAVLYLENKLVSGAFTPQHLIALEVIAAQAAIALATADLFAKLERENTERRRAEAFLEESRGKLQQIIDNSSAVIFVKDTEGRYLLANRAFENLFHFARDQVKGKTDEYLPLPRESLEVFRANDQAALGAERALEMEETVVAEGVAHTFLSHKFPLHDAAGRPYAVCGIASDITGRKLFEDQLRASVSLLQATLESTFDAILVVDTEGRVVQSNTRFAHTWGMRHDMPFDLGKLRRPVDFHAELDRLSRHPNDSSFAIVEFEDGRVFESYSQPQRMDQRVVGRVWSFRDVTVRIWAERERDRLLVDERRARAAAEEAVRLRDEFLSVASHELRTPLTSLQLAIQGLLRHLGNDVSAPAARNLALCNRQVRRLGTLVGLLLDVSRIQAGRLELDRHLVDLRDIVRESVEQLAEDFARSGSLLTVRAEQPVIGSWDSSRMEQLSINLLTNAIKFGDGKPIEVTVDKTPGMARLRVTDGGIGMPSEVQERIFERFGRAVSARHYAGLGLGLFIVRTIVEAHGGRVFVTSSVGNGSTFTVELPIWPMPPSSQRALGAMS